MSVAAAVRSNPVQPLPREAATVSAEILRSTEKWIARSASQAVHFSVRRSNAPNSEFTVRTHCPARARIAIYLLYNRNVLLGTPRGIRMMNIPEQG